MKSRERMEALAERLPAALGLGPFDPVLDAASGLPPMDATDRAAVADALVGLAPDAAIVSVLSGGSHPALDKAYGRARRTLRGMRAGILEAERDSLGAALRAVGDAARKGDVAAARALAQSLAVDERAMVAVDDLRDKAPDDVLLALVEAVAGLTDRGRALRWLLPLAQRSSDALAGAAARALPSDAPVARACAVLAEDAEADRLLRLANLLVDGRRGDVPEVLVSLLVSLLVAPGGGARHWSEAARMLAQLGDRGAIGRLLRRRFDRELGDGATRAVSVVWGDHPWGEEWREGLRAIDDGRTAGMFAERIAEARPASYVAELGGLRVTDVPVGTLERRPASEELAARLADGRLAIVERHAELRRAGGTTGWTRQLIERERLQLVERAWRARETAEGADLALAARMALARDVALERLLPVAGEAGVDLAIEPDTAALALAVVGGRGDTARAVGLVPLVRLAREGGWTVAGARLRVGGRDLLGARPSAEEVARHRLADVRCDCGASSPCAHALALALSLLARDDAWRARLTRPAWQAALGELVVEEEGEHARHAGWVRYDLVRDDEDGAAGWGIERTLIRRALRGNRVLKPMKMPESFAVAESRVRGLTEVDRRLHDALDDLEAVLWRGIFSWQADPSTRLHFASRLRGEVLRLLAGARDVRLDGRPVRVEAQPLTPGLRVRDGLSGGLEVALDPPLRGVIPSDPPYALTEDDRLAPLADGVRLSAGLIAGFAVPAGEVASFVADGLQHVALPVQLEAEALAEATLAARLDARVVLAAAPVPQAVEVSLDLVYVSEEDGETVARVVAGIGHGMLRIADATGATRLVERDLAGELSLRGQVEAYAGALPAMLEGDHALDFLADGLPALLADGVQVLGDRRLLDRVVRDELVAKVGGSESALDMQVIFGLDAEGGVASADALRVWASGRRWVELDDGRIARLPEEWLARRGHALTELEALRREDGTLPEFALTLAAPLLEEGGPALERWRAAARALAERDGVPEQPEPPGLEATLRDYQRRGADWLAFLHERGFGGVLADEMGLGKTVQALALLAGLHAEPGPPSLVVAPTSVLHNWRVEAGRFTPGLRVVVHHGSNRDPEAWESADLVVTSYALLRLDPAVAAATWRVAILDEAQAIKNPASQTAAAARSLDARTRLALTGTPLENRLLELWSLFEYLMPGFFGSRASFRTRYSEPIGRGDREAAGALQRRLRPFILRRTKAEVATELPPLTVCVRACELGPEQREVYERVRRRYRDKVLTQVAEIGVARSAFTVLEALTRLRQACCDPRLLPQDLGGDGAGSAKLDLLLQTLEALRDDGHRALVFSQWPSLLRLAGERLSAVGIEYLFLDGATRQRQQLVDRWNDPGGPPAFLISLKAGGSGLNLAAADHVIHLDPWWNPAVEAQATDRAHRIGQTRPVTCYKLVATDTIEEHVLALQERKQALTATALEGATRVVDALTADDLHAVFAEGTVVGP